MSEQNVLVTGRESITAVHYYYSGSNEIAFWRKKSRPVVLTRVVEIIFDKSVRLIVLRIVYSGKFWSGNIAQHLHKIAQRIKLLQTSAVQTAVRCRCWTLSARIHSFTSSKSQRNNLSQKHWKLSTVAIDRLCRQIGSVKRRHRQT